MNTLSAIMTPELLAVMDNLPFPLSYAETSETPIRIAFINKEFKRVFGYEIEDIADIDSWLERAYPEEAYRLEVMKSWNRDAEVAFKNQGSLPTREVEICSSDGRRIRTLLNGSYVGSSVVLAYVDISQQALAEAELRDVKQHLERTAYELTENLPVGTYTMVQPASGGLAQFRFMSPRFLEITGLDREQAQRDPIKAFECIHPDDHERWLELNTQAFTHKTPFFGETRIAVNGETRWVAAESKPRPLADGSTIWEGVLIDITDRKLAQESLASAKARAEQLEKIKSDFLTRMSHEIRTPLTLMLGLTDLLADEQDKATQAEKLAQLRNAGHLLLGIVNDILDLSKIEAGQLITESRAFEVASLIAYAQAFEASITKPGLRLLCSHPTGSLPLMLGDQRRIEQVMGNLIGNAIKFTEKGLVTVTFELAQDAPKVARLKIAVQDSGIGIAEQQLSSLFTPFMQSDTSTWRQYGGSGLGLSISKELVELMGGRIGVQSQLGSGSTFWFELPLPIAEPNNQPSEASSWRTERSSKSKPLVGLRILVVDDSLSIRGLIRVLLEREGAAVELAENTMVAIEILRARGREFDCVMMDVQMPGLDGLSATRHIHQLPHLRHLPILAMTAGLLAEQQVLAREAGMADVVSKPVQTARMVEQILQVVKPANQKTSRDHTLDVGIPDIEGIDPNYINQSIDGGRDMFDLLAASFLQEFTGFDHRLSHALSQSPSEESIAAARILIHSLRGASSQLGAMELSEACAELESTLEAPSNVRATDWISLTVSLNGLLESLRQHLAGESPPS